MVMARMIWLAAVALCVVSCEGTGARRVARIGGVKTTAYTHTEKDHLVHGTNTAIGSQLKYGGVRSAASDWSVFPLGTVFKIDGDSCVYQIDDYGSALVGTNNIDLYTPNKQAMEQWGARHVNINVIKWGSFRQSLAVMKQREKRAPHVHEMVKRIETSS